jgi:hypothetical protein
MVSGFSGDVLAVLGYSGDVLVVRAFCGLGFSGDVLVDDLVHVLLVMNVCHYVRGRTLPDCDKSQISKGRTMHKTSRRVRRGCDISSLQNRCR